ncbi:hypothetical protein BGZ76_007533 [Entomortierella beljakovae]|nr:hypothetical protein BGZ76_007533 [Entomortierella beljakovae]
MVNETDITKQVDNLKKSKGQLPATNIRYLSIKALGTNIDLEIVAPLLEKSLQVVSLYLCQPYTQETLRQISNKLLDDNGPRLEYLGIEKTMSDLQIIPSKPYFCIKVI